MSDDTLDPTSAVADARMSRRETRRRRSKEAPGSAEDQTDTATTAPFGDGDDTTSKRPRTSCSSTKSASQGRNRGSPARAAAVTCFKLHRSIRTTEPAAPPTLESWLLVSWLDDVVSGDEPSEPASAAARVDAEEPTRRSRRRRRSRYPGFPRLAPALEPRTLQLAACRVRR